MLPSMVTGGVSYNFSAFSYKDNDFFLFPIEYKIVSSPQYMTNK